MESGQKCDLCGVFHLYVKCETWQGEDNEVNIPQTDVVFALLIGDRVETNICEMCYDNHEIEVKLSRDEAREVFYQFGLEFARCRRLEKSKAAHLKSLKISENAACLASLGYVEDELGNRDEAIEYYNRALKIDPSNGVAKENLRLLKRG